MAVAEVIADMAPGASVYLADITDVIDMKAAVDWFADNGVRIITKSSTGVYDGPGNGTGPFAAVVAYAESRGVAWFNSAGNAAGGGSYKGSYFRSAWVDTDGDGWMNFPGGSEYLGFPCAYISGLRWNDWGANRTDYDLFLAEDTTSLTWLKSSEVDQQAGALPLETFPDGQGCTSGGDLDYVAIKLFAGGNGTAGDVLEFMVNGTGLQSWSNPFSVTQPGGDVANPGASVIGAIDPVDGTTIAPYSSQGPTNDGRIKPDLSAASNMTNFALGGHFNGTSAATPVAAGAAAVLLGAYPQWTPAQLGGAIRGQVVDRGVAGPDNVYGTGELYLSPPAGPPAPQTGPPGAVRGLSVHGPAWSQRRRVVWAEPAATGGLPILQYVVEVYAGRKRIARAVVPGGRHAVRLRNNGVRPGKYKVFVAAGNAAGWGPWAKDSFRIRRS